MKNTNDGLVYVGRLPTQLVAVNSPPAEYQFAFANDKNEAYLRASLQPLESADIDEHEEISQELRRQELKINLLLDMVGELLLQQTGMPPVMELRLTSAGFECAAPELDLSVGQVVEASIYLTPSIPKALRLYGSITSRDDASTVVEFLGINRVVQELLEKIVFRHHRRAIAQGIADK